MTDIEHFIGAAGTTGSMSELHALRSMIHALGSLLDADRRGAVARDDFVLENLDAYLPEDRTGLDPAEPGMWLLAARRHGEESEPDHEIGDLQTVARAAWGQMTDAEKGAFAYSEIALSIAPGSDAPRA